jgi:hypothetical protein
MLSTATGPDDLVRLYDGADNPIGRAYTRSEIASLLADRFQLLETVRFGLPRHAMRIRVPDILYRFASHRFGLMIAFRAAKR